MMTVKACVNCRWFDSGRVGLPLEDAGHIGARGEVCEHPNAKVHNRVFGTFPALIAPWKGYGRVLTDCDAEGRFERKPTRQPEPEPERKWWRIFR